LITGCAVYSVTDRNTCVPGGLGYLLDAAVEFLDIAQVDAHRGATSLDGLEDIPRLEVDVSDHLDRGLLGDDRQGLGVARLRASHSDDIAARRGQLGDRKSVV